MEPKYGIGQRVIVKPVKEQTAIQRQSDVESYAGQVGEVSKYYWITPRASQIFYIYSVRVGAGVKEITLYEDEIESCLG